MTTGAIIAIVVAVLIVIALLAYFVPRFRGRARERELQSRRREVAREHREVAGAHERDAEVAEQRARIAAREADAQRAQAELHEERAGMHDRGMADDELVETDERAAADQPARFGRTSAGAEAEGYAETDPRYAETAESERRRS
jgi:hypothetical protein